MAQFPSAFREENTQFGGRHFAALPGDTVSEDCMFQMS
jgi:hypothetical protein